MAATRVALPRTGLIDDIGTISLIVTAAGIVDPLILFWIARGTSARSLFERPAWAWFEAAPTRLVPALGFRWLVVFLHHAAVIHLHAHPPSTRLGQVAAERAHKFRLISASHARSFRRREGRRRLRP